MGLGCCWGIGVLSGCCWGVIEVLFVGVLLSPPLPPNLDSLVEVFFGEWDVLNQHC